MFLRYNMTMCRSGGEHMEALRIMKLRGAVFDALLMWNTVTFPTGSLDIPACV